MTEQEKEGLEMKLIFNDGYFHLRDIPGRGICGLRKFVFTVGLCYGLDETGYVGRYCFSEISEAMGAIDQWKERQGLGDPPGEWIKHKGYREYRNERVIIQKKYMETGVKPVIIAVRSVTDGVLSIYGEGEYLGEKVPDRAPFNMIGAGIPNPCIKITDGGINDGKLVWGFMCWWSEKEKFLEKYAESITQTVVVPIPEDIPIYEPKVPEV
jgi:hypothetical protein